MMKTQFYVEHSGTLSLRWGEAIRIDGVAGEFEVLSGRVWLTRQGDLDDHVLQAGEAIELAAGDVAVVEPWQRTVATSVAWRPHAQRRPVAGLPREPAEAGLRGLA
jgi:hypothetical protein